MRLSTSRPRGSVPRGKLAEGACIRIGNPRSFRLSAYGSRGARIGAKIATITSARMINALAAPSGFRRKNVASARHRSAGTANRGAVLTAVRGMDVSAVPDSWIKPRVAQVDEQIRHHDHRGEEQHGALDEGVVPQ